MAYCLIRWLAEYFPICNKVGQMVGRFIASLSSAVPLSRKCKEHVKNVYFIMSLSIYRSNWFIVRLQNLGQNFFYGTHCDSIVNFTKITRITEDLHKAHVWTKSSSRDLNSELWIRKSEVPNGFFRITNKTRLFVSTIDYQNCDNWLIVDTFEIQRDKFKKYCSASRFYFQYPANNKFYFNFKDEEHQIVLFLTFPPCLYNYASFFRFDLFDTYHYTKVFALQQSLL